MQNAILTVTLPKGLRLKNGATLYRDVSFDFVSEITPYYTSVDIVRLVGGPFLGKIPDLTIASMIFNMSQQADSHTYVAPPTPMTKDPSDPGYRRFQLFQDARSNWVSNMVAADLIGNVADLAGARGSKTLANFSVERLTGINGEGIPQRVQDLNKEAEKWRIVLNSGGDVGFGGHVKGSWGAKGLYDADYPAGRTWVVTGMGANSKSVPGFGSAGKPVKYASGPFLAWRMGRSYNSFLIPYSQPPMNLNFMR